MKKGTLIYGVGINDADYVVSWIVDGKRVKCKYYQTWRDMFKRSYSSKYHEKHPTYKGCSVDKEWHHFMDFRKWMVDKNWKDKHLDKDILVPGNKIYSSKTCVFVDPKINSLLTDSAAKRGECLQGVDIKRGKFRAQMKIKGKKTHIGLYETQEQVSKAYRKAKKEYLIEISNLQEDEFIRNGLIANAEKFS